MKCRYFCRLPLDISPVYLTRGISVIYMRNKTGGTTVKIKIKTASERHE